MVSSKRLEHQEDKMNVKVKSNTSCNMCYKDLEPGNLFRYDTSIPGTCLLKLEAVDGPGWVNIIDNVASGYSDKRYANACLQPF